MKWDIFLDGELYFSEYKGDFDQMIMLVKSMLRNHVGHEISVKEVF